MEVHAVSEIKGTWSGRVEENWPAPVDIVAAGQKLVSGTDSRAALIFKTPEEARKILAARDAMVLAEAFVHGRMDMEGDIYTAISLKDWLHSGQVGIFDKAQIVLRFLREWHTHGEERDGQYIRHHYDHPNQFYRLFLGQNMTYSCAYFNDPEEDLDVAQGRKVDHLLSKLRLKPGEKLLDIGCGWGSLIIKAAADYGAEALGVTLSPSQYEYAKDRIKREGLEKHCRVELCDYRRLPADEKFDKIVSVGMYEHVGGKYLNVYFEKIFSLLRDDGLFVNHGITRVINPDWSKASEALFMNKYIFPGGELHPVSWVARLMEETGFEVFDIESLRRHYALTLRRWVRNLQDKQEEALELVPETVFRAWVIYMAGCALAFEEGYLNVHQVSGSRSRAFGGTEIPLTRDHLYNQSENAA
jgi:cyclopropane-fatty-acyl-phospholipid synthase